MSASKWKSRGEVRPYVPRNWAISHVALCGQVRESPQPPEGAIELAKLRAMVDQLAQRVEEALAVVK